MIRRKFSREFKLEAVRLVTARGVSNGESFVRSRAQLAFLASAIQARILDGTLPPDIPLERLVRTTLPSDWSQQAQMLGL